MNGLTGQSMQADNNLNSPHELDFLLKSLSTSDDQNMEQVVQNETQETTTQLQNFVNLSFNHFPVQDKTPSPYYSYSPIAPSPHEFYPTYSSLSPDTFLQNKRRKRNVERPIDLDRSRIAQRRKRDESGKFLKKEVANKIEELEEKLRLKEEECNNLRQALSAKDQELTALRNQIQNEIIDQSLLQTPHVATIPTVPMINLPSRNYVLLPNPNPQQLGNEREAFKKKIDYSKIQLRKTVSLLDDEKREVLLSQEQWEERHRLNAFLRKLEEQQRWYHNFEFSEVPVQHQNYLYGGPPSNIYSPPTKIGNLQVPAFTTKVDFSSKREELGKKAVLPKTSVPKGHYYLVEQPQQTIHTSPTRVKSSSISTPRQIRQPTPNKLQFQIPTQFQPTLQSQMQNIQPYPNLDQTLWEHEGMDLVDGANELYSIPRRHPLGGPPSNIYTPPSKIGNLPVPAFTQKIDFSEIELRKTEGPYSSSPPL